MADDLDKRKTVKENTVDELEEQIGRKEARKIRARRHKEESLWYWFGMLGMVGWAVVLPMLIGIAVGVWLDAAYETRISWTLTLLFVGVVLGCLNAWHWIKKEGTAAGSPKEELSEKEKDD